MAEMAVRELMAILVVLRVDNHLDRSEQPGVFAQAVEGRQVNKPTQTTVDYA